MDTITDEVINYILRDVSLRRSLTRGYINTRALAKYIQTQLHLSCSIDAVITAIRRFQEKHEFKDDIKNIYRQIACVKFTSRSGMCSLLLKKTKDVRENLENINNKVNVNNGEVIRHFEVSQYIKIIVDISNLTKIIEFFKKTDIIKVEKNLCEIILMFEKDIGDTPGIFAVLSSEFAMNQVSIRDTLVCGSEQIILLDQKNLLASLQILNTIVVWAEKTK